MSPRIVRRIAWLMVVAVLLLSSIGLTLQALTGSTYTDVGLGVLILVALAFLIWAAVGALLVSRHPAHPVGWAWCLIALIPSLDNFTYGYAYFGLIAHPGSLPAAELMLVWQVWSGMPFGIPLIALIFLVFPNGRFLSPRWRYLAWMITGSVVIYLVISALIPRPIIEYPFPERPVLVSPKLAALLDPVRWASLGASLTGLLASTFSLIVRWRRAHGDERQQIKWLVYPASFFVPGALIQLFSRALPAAYEWTFQLGITLQILAVVGLAAGSALAIFRYRLYDIDIIIQRTLVYAILTAVLTGIYFVGVATLQSLVTLIGGEQSPLVIVVSTLGTAALFAPLRNRIQAFIDRSFYRQKYDAERTLARFARNTRDETDLDALTAELLRVVNETLRPDRISVVVLDPQGQ